MLATLKGNVVDYIFDGLDDEVIAKPCLIADGRAHSYGDLLEHIDRAGDILRSLGARPGDRIMLCMRDGLDFPAFFFGAIKEGIIPVPLNTYLTTKDYIYYLNDSGSRVLLVEADIFETMLPAIGELRNNPAIMTVRGRIDGYSCLDDRRADPTEPRGTFNCAPDDTAFWLYSSGSTGSPKGVVHTHQHMFSACELFGLPMQGICQDDVILCPPKMFFAYGLGNQVYFPLKAKATTVCTSAPIKPESVWREWITHRPTVFMGVPTLFSGMIAYAEEHLSAAEIAEACSRTRFCVSGGEVLPPTLLNRWRTLTGLDILDGVGTTEMTHMFIVNRPGAVVPGSCGKPVPGFEAVLLGEDGKPVSQGEIGSLFAKGPTAALEYWNKPEKTAETMRDGGVFTGDKYYQDTEGNLFYVGRGDDMLRIGAIWVSPTEIENIITEHSVVQECAIVGAPNADGLVRPAAYVVLRKTGEGVCASAALAEEIKDYVKSKLPRFKCPARFEFVPDLPKTATGKIQRFRLRELSSKIEAA